MKKFILLVLLGATLLGPAFGAEEYFSPWAAEELTEGDKMGLYPLEMLFNKTDFKAPIPLGELKDLQVAAREKLLKEGIPEKDGISVTFKANTRGAVIDSLGEIYRDFTPGEEEKQDIPLLRDIEVLRGNGKSINEKGICTRQEAIALYTRLTRHILYERGLGSRGFLWEVQGNGAKAYLFGSIHSGNHDMYPVSRKVMEHFAEAQEVYFEIESEDSKGQKYLEEKRYHRDGRTLKDDLGEGDYGALKRVMDGFGIPEETYRNYRPWAAYLFLSMNPLEAERGSYLGVESYLTQKAVLAGKPIGQIESIPLQTDLLSNYREEDYLLLLRAQIEEVARYGFARMDRGLTRLQDLWIRGDEEGLNETLEGETPEERRYNEMLLGERNRYMARRIEEILGREEKKTVFIVVGAAHLTPEDSVLSILKNQGYKVKHLGRGDVLPR